MTRRRTPATGTPSSAVRGSRTPGVRGERLGVSEDIFWRTHHGMGLPLSMQGLWRFDTTVTAADLEPAYRALAAGPLNRRVVRRRIWPARNRFATDATLAPIHEEPGLLAPGTITAWADERGDTTLDIDAGPVWELSVARIEGGGSVVSLVCSHVVADARALVGAAGVAAGDQPSATQSFGAVRSASSTLGDDVRDAASQLRIVVGGVARSLWMGCRDAAHRAELLDAARRSAPAPAPAKASGAPNWREPTAILSVDADAWNRAAAEHGGTSNTLFTALVGELVLQIRGSGPVELALPVAGGGTGANSLTTAVIGISTIDECHDLPLLRRRARDGYTAAGEGSGLGPPAGMPAELLQVIGHRAAYALVPDPGARDGLASNLGVLDGILSVLAGHRGRAIAARSVHPRLTADGTRATRTSVAGWAAVAGGVITITLAVPDPAVASGDDLRELITKALGRWELTASQW